MGRAVVRLLLDTHAFIWWLEGNRRLSPAAVAEIEASIDTTFVSAATAWEVATLIRLGKLEKSAHWTFDVVQAVADACFTTLPVTFPHAEHAGRMDGAHRDPFDRMIAAQALLENMVLVSRDIALDDFGVNRLW